MFWFILVLVCSIIIALSIFLMNNWNDTAVFCGSILFGISAILCGVGLVFLIITPIKINEMKEMQRSREYFTSEKLNEFNAFVAETKAHPLMYLGYDLTGIEYIKPSEGDSVKVEVKK
jgi:hypothetical protein